MFCLFFLILNVFCIFILPRKNVTCAKLTLGANLSLCKSIFVHLCNFDPFPKVVAWKMPTESISMLWGKSSKMFSSQSKYTCFKYNRNTTVNYFLFSCKLLLKLVAFFCISMIIILFYKFVWVNILIEKLE